MPERLATPFDVDDDCTVWPLVKLKRPLSRVPAFGGHTLWLRACPKCGGDMRAEDDEETGWEGVCLLCGKREGV